MALVYPWFKNIQTGLFAARHVKCPQQNDPGRNHMDYALNKADHAEKGGGQEAAHLSPSASSRHPNPEDIELARKRVELSLYLDKAAEHEKEFSALRESLIEFGAQLIRLIESKGAVLEASAAINARGISTGRPASMKTIPFRASTTPLKADSGTAQINRPRISDKPEEYLPIITAICNELRSDAMLALLGEDILRGQGIPPAAFTLITGTAPARCTDQPDGDSGNRTGAELILVIRQIYAARERILFLHRGIMKLRFSMLYQLMMEVQKADENGIDLLGCTAGQSR